MTPQTDLREKLLRARGKCFDGTGSYALVGWEIVTALDAALASLAGAETPQEVTFCATCKHQEACHEDGGRCHWYRPGSKATVNCHCSAFVPGERRVPMSAPSLLRAAAPPPAVAPAALVALVQRLQGAERAHEIRRTPATERYYLDALAAVQDWRPTPDAAAPPVAATSCEGVDYTVDPDDVEDIEYSGGGR